MTHRPSDSAPGTLPFEIALTNQQSRHSVQEDQLISAARAVLQDSDFASATISLAIVDDKAIHDLNRRHLNHDYPTDVLSFVLSDEGSHLEGEVIISADAAISNAGEHGTSPENEQLLYVIHGMLHLVGYRDKSADDAQEMRAAEARYLQQFDPNGLSKRRSAR
jgi:probable rRNA maturation factor